MKTRLKGGAYLKDFQCLYYSARLSALIVHDCESLDASHGGQYLFQFFFFCGTFILSLEQRVPSFKVISHFLQVLRGLWSIPKDSLLYYPVDFLTHTKAIMLRCTTVSIPDVYQGLALIIRSRFDSRYGEEYSNRHVRNRICRKALTCRRHCRGN